MNDPNSTGARRVGRVWGYGAKSRKGWGKRYIAHKFRHWNKIIARKMGEEDGRKHIR